MTEVVPACSPIIHSSFTQPLNRVSRHRTSTPCGNADTCGAGRPTRPLLGNPVHQHDRIDRACTQAAHFCSSFRAREGLTTNVADDGTLCAGEQSDATSLECSLLCVYISHMMLNFTPVIAKLIGYLCIHVRNACQHLRNTRLTEVVRTDRLTDRGCSYGWWTPYGL